MYWGDWLKKHASVLDASRTPYEWKFATTVLTKVRGLDPACVHPQHPVPDSSGSQRRIDFAITPVRGVQLAIEVDGWDKVGRGHGPTREEQEAARSRQNDLVAQGWSVLGFPNRRFSVDPTACAKTIELTLRSLTARVTGQPGLTAPEQAELEHLSDLMRDDGIAAVGSSDGKPAAPGPIVTTSDPHPAAQRSRPVWLIVSVAAVVLIAVGLAAFMVLRTETPGTDPTGRYTCPSDAPIKGNVSLSGEKIYHVPGGEFYDATSPERCFSDEESATKAGYRKSQR